MSLFSSFGFRLIGTFSLVTILCLAGCGSSSDSVDEGGQSIARDGFAMRIDERFITADISRLINSALRSTLIQAYSIPSPSSDFFEKNIIISREASPDQDLASYATDVSEAIRQTWGGYQRIDLSNTSFRCGEEDIPLILHGFSLTRGDITATGSQAVFFVQSIFKSKGVFYIISASSDDENDMDVFQGYANTLICESEE